MPNFLDLSGGDNKMIALSYAELFSFAGSILIFTFLGCRHFYKKGFRTAINLARWQVRSIISLGIKDSTAALNKYSNDISRLGR